MNKYNFFISYTRRDGIEIARQVSDQLAAKGYSVFMDAETLQAGNFAESIAEAIANCDCFIPIITEAYNSSEWAKNEFRIALSKAEGRAKQILPIVSTEQLDKELELIISHIQQLKFSKDKELSAAICDVVEKIDKFIGVKLKTSVLYEKLFEYKKLSSHNKEAETICELISLTHEEYKNSPKREFRKIIKICKELLQLYEQLSKYVGSYDEESRKTTHRIIDELDKTYDMLSDPSANHGKNLFNRHIVFASFAIRLIYLDREIRLECVDVLSNGDVHNAFPISKYIEKQKAFVDVFYEDYETLEQGNYEETHKQFVEETKNFIFQTSNRNQIASEFEKDVYSVLTKQGYNIDVEVRLGKYIVDMAIKKNGEYTLYIECSASLTKGSISIERERRHKDLADYIKNIGSKLHIIQLDDWNKNPQTEIEKIKSIIDNNSSYNDEILISIAKFIQEGNKLFDVLQKNGVAGDFLECLRESYERLKNYCVIVGANDVAADCAERIVEIRRVANKYQGESSENEKVEKGIKSLLGFTLEGSGKYDVFISFKNEDSDLAEKVYEYCNKHMKQPFWSKKSLPRLSKSEYSKAIDDALENSKHFVVVLSDLNYLNAEWISYEMDVFHNEKKEGRKDKSSNFVILVTDDIYDEIKKKTVLPIAYRRYQIIKMSEYEETLAQYIS